MVPIIREDRGPVSLRMGRGLPRLRWSLAMTHMGTLAFAGGGMTAAALRRISRHVFTAGSGG